MKFHNISNQFLFFLILGITCSSCEDLIEINPPKTKIVNSTVYADDATAISALVGIYSRMMQTDGLANYNTTKYAGLSSDEFVNYLQSVNQTQFFENSLQETNSTVSNLWASGYSLIFHSNAILDGLKTSSGLSESVKAQLEGEAKFIRAFCHFYIANFWGDIPLITTTDYRQNAIASRISKDIVYTQIISDLLDAQRLLQETYPSADRVRPNKYAATALLARVYLYMEDWINAEIQATTVLNESAVYSLELDLNNVFLKGSKEAIWQLLPWFNGVNTLEGSQFIPTTSAPEVGLSPELIGAFEPNDKRYTNWVGNITLNGIPYTFPYKYKVKSGSTPTEYYVVLRLSELLLIRAESRAQQNKLSEAIEDIDRIRQRAGIPLIADINPSIDKSALLLSIEQERRAELFAEWGHRWFDLKRTNRANAILANTKPGWNDTDILYPIPLNEINIDPNLKPQNEGY